MVVTLGQVIGNSVVLVVGEVEVRIVVPLGPVVTVPLVREHFVLRGRVLGEEALVAVSLVFKILPCSLSPERVLVVIRVGSSSGFPSVFGAPRERLI